jgi:glycosyltransferase involved in cell wall biosynthesis
MKISIIQPVYNGEECLEKSIEALLNLDYPAGDFEVIEVNDGSKDSTHKIQKKFTEKFKSKGISYKTINFDQNQGRIVARETGARKACFDNLLFIDHRCIAHDNILKKIAEIDYSPLIGNLYQDPNRSLPSRFFYVFRRFLYRPYFGEKFPDVYIDKENFDSIPKGFSPFFCTKDLLLASLPKEKDPNVNDDTRIFRNVIEEKKILKTSEVKITYLERDNFKEMLWHIFHRGPRFVDFYFKPGSKYFPMILAALVLPVSLFALTVLEPNLLIGAFGLGFAAAITIAATLSKSFADFLSIVLIGPLIITSFLLGIYKGIIIKIFKTAKK